MDRKLVFAVVAAAALSLLLGVARASAWHKDPDSQVDPVKVIASSVLPTPDVTIGDADTTAIGIGDAAVGAADMSYADPPHGTTYWVDNTPLSGDCPQATFVSIQAAVNASGPNDTVKVCPGTYMEQVTIAGPGHDGLRLESLTPLGATIQFPGTLSTNHQLIDISDADDVTIRGFVISGPYTSAGCSVDRYEGVLFENHATDGRLDHNHVTLIRDANPAFWGCQQGDAVAIGRRLPAPPPPPPPAVPASAEIDHNVIDRYQKNGVQAVNPGTEAIIHHNTINASTDTALQAMIASNGIVVFREAAATVEFNSVANNRYTPFPLSTGIILDEAPAGSSEVDHNTVFDNDYGIETDTQTGLDISHNSVYDNLADAITLCGEVAFGCGPAEQIVVRANDVTGNRGSGITLQGADSNLLKSNHVENNGDPAGDTTDGIRVDSTSMDNQILDNHMHANVHHDCHDDSNGAGSGVPPTANIWSGDSGDTENRDGLCRFATVTP
jgi:parallel beta-helix repeat protein